jgi:hypothetical protein
VTFPLSLTGEYVQEPFDQEIGMDGPSYVLIRVNGQEAVHLPTQTGWLSSAREQQDEVQETFVEFLRDVFRRCWGSRSH